MRKAEVPSPPAAEGREGEMSGSGLARVADRGGQL